MSKRAVLPRSPAHAQTRRITRGQILAVFGVSRHHGVEHSWLSVFCNRVFRTVCSLARDEHVRGNTKILRQLGSVGFADTPGTADDIRDRLTGYPRRSSDLRLSDTSNFYEMSDQRATSSGTGEFGHQRSFDHLLPKTSNTKQHQLYAGEPPTLRIPPAGLHGEKRRSSFLGNTTLTKRPQQHAGRTSVQDDAIVCRCRIARISWRATFRLR